MVGRFAAFTKRNTATATITMMINTAVVGLTDFRTRFHLLSFH
jgi:hypothetical protein